MPYCENCGAQINPNAKFCGSCGAARNQPATNPTQVRNQPAPTPAPAQAKRQSINYYSPPPANAYVPPPPVPTMQAPANQQPPMQPYTPPTQPATQPVAANTPMPQPGGETAVGVILLRKPKSMGRWDTFTGVVTTHRLIFAQMTSQMLTDAAKQSRDQAKAEGKGFFGQWADQLRATFGYTKKYLTMPPQAILAETPGNFALDNNSISRINVHLKGAHNERNQRREFEIKFYSNTGTYEFRMDENSEFIDTLKGAYAQRVDMPFGYFAKSINIKI
jgi:hypothetical protein